MLISLYDYLRQVYESGLIQKLGFVDQVYRINDNSELSFDELINDNHWCLEIIRTNLDFRSNNFQINKAYAYRFRHIVICWLLGIGFMDFIAQTMKYDMIFQRTWQLSVFTHDYGWFCDEAFSKPETGFLSSFGDYYLLKDNYNTPTLACLQNFMANNPNITPYTYDVIERYYFSSINYHKQQKELGNTEDKETCDHGVVGACLAFKEYAEFIEKRKQLAEGASIIEINKTACLITASHNIWGGDKIRKENELLSIMALVDTIECTKLFTYYDKANRSKSLISWKDLYSHIKLSIDKTNITLQLHDLVQYVDSLNQNKRFVEIKTKLDKYCNSLKRIDTWTPFSVVHNGYELTVSYK